ncbi:MAG: PHP domain-containing protein [Bacillota bacterium]
MEIFKKNRKTIFQLLLAVIALILSQRFAGLLPGFWGLIIHFLAMVIWAVFLGLLVIFLGLQIIQNFRLERSFIPDNLYIRPLPALKKYRILNPLEGPGSFYKAQLHTHSSHSYDSKVPPEEIIQSYKNDGYQILAITDHDRYSDFSHYSTGEMLIIPGSEETIPVLFWPIPLGRHLVLINPVTKRLHIRTVKERLDEAAASDSLAIPAHLSWRGGAGTGRWYPEELLRLKNLQFVEIHSPHSQDPVDFIIWHKLIKKNGPERPVWGIAVDDSHSGSRQNGWIMVKMPRLDLPSFIASLKKGSFYASGKLTLDIRVEETRILVNSPGAAWIRFFNAQNLVIAAVRGEQAVYQSVGDEGFIRVEAADPRDRKAWSQPMWLVPAEES